MKHKHTVAFDDLVACPGCDLLHHRQVLDAGRRACCVRCGDILYTHKPHTVDRTLAASIAGILLLVVSLVLPFLSLSRAGFSSQISVLDAVWALWNSDMRWLGLLTLDFIVVLPLLRLVLLVWVLGRIRWHRRIVPAMSRALRWALLIEPWAMAEIFMVGVVVSLIKIGSIARLDVGPAFWSLLGLIVVSIVISIALCRDTLWQHLSIHPA